MRSFLRLLFALFAPFEWADMRGFLESKEDKRRRRESIRRGHLADIARGDPGD